MVFPEYFTLQLLTLGDVKRPITEQIRGLAAQVERFARYSRWGRFLDLRRQLDPDDVFLTPYWRGKLSVTA